MTLAVPLRNKAGEVVARALVDDEDYELIHLSRWCLDRKGYATARVGGRTVRMHRVIMGVTDPRVQVDHIDRDPLNNTRANLRLANNAENHQNVAGGHSNTGVRGVTWDKSRQKYLAGAKLNYKRYNLGRFDTLEEAAAVVAAWRAKHMPYSEEAASVAHA